MASMQTIEIDAHVNFALVRPGDTLIVTVSRLMSDQEVTDATLDLEAKLPGVRVVFITATAVASYRPDPVRSMMQGFAAARSGSCPWGAPANCHCAHCYRP